MEFQQVYFPARANTWEAIQSFDFAPVPSSNDGAALGAASTGEWSDVFLASGGVINWDNGDVTITHSSNLITIAGGNIAVGDAAVYSSIGSMSFDIDSDNSGTGSSFKITKDNGATTIFELSENGDLAIAYANGFSVGASNSAGNVGIEVGNSSSSGGVAYLDMHFGVSGSQDYNVRVQNNADQKLNIVTSTFTGSILDLDFETFQIGSASSTISMIPPGSSQTNASIRWENQVATADATINAYQDANGTDVWIMSNCYLNAGTVTRFDTGEESSYVAVGRTGYIYFGTNTSAGNATTQFNIDPNGDMNVTSGNVIQGATTANFINLDSSNNLIVGTPDNNVIVSLDSDNDGTTSTFIVQADGGTTRFSVTEDGNTTVTSASTTSNSFVVTADSKTTGSVAQFNSNSADTNNRNLVKITNDNSLATGARGLFIQQDSTANCIFLDHNDNGRALEIDSEVTTSQAVEIDVSAITTGNGLRVYSNSADTSNRILSYIVNDNAAAVGCTPFKIQQDAVVSTNFRMMYDLNGITIYISDGTTPNGALSGTAGDICFGGPSGQAFYCSSGTTWVGM